MAKSKRIKLTSGKKTSATITSSQVTSSLKVTNTTTAFVGSSKPGAPTIGTATATGATTATVAFTAPASNGGAAITSYTVTSSPGSITVTGATSPITITGLTAGQAYTFTVKATNSAGTSSASSASNSITPALQQTLWSFGYNWTGQLGIGVSGYAGANPYNRSSPVQVGSNYWKAINKAPTQDSNAAIKSDGTLWTWGGINIRGGLGQGISGYPGSMRSSPCQVGSGTNWQLVNIAGGGGYAAATALKTDGTLWTWGYNGYGTLGLGNTSDRSAPAQVGSGTNWAQVSSTSSVVAIKTDGTMWTWGANYNGNLGLGDTTTRSSPVQVGALTTWAKASAGIGHIAAIKTDGTLWTFGYNRYGQLGLSDGGTGTNRSSPVQVGSGTDWAMVACGCYHTIAIKTNGTMWTWGKNSITQTVGGALGLGDVNDRSSPCQVGALTTWSRVSGGYATSAAIKTNGTLWTWGQNSYGQLGLGDSGGGTYRSSPTQVGALTTWTDINSCNFPLGLHG